ncbi:hypothetical protein MKX08_008297 [Trichoderma sp. CBMAI-0020]|nr:hypothetical protein MKX08_008297 [Trichoderma sp. CBMAI-0020]
MSGSEASTTPALPRNEYTIGWVCALSTELTAATAMLDQEHELLSNPPGDKNVYTLGSIRKHNIVIACLPKGKQGTTSAAVVATQMLESFSSIKFGLMIGVGGGIPTKDHDIRLGDVVVSTPTSMFPGVVQLDLGKAIEGGGFERIGSLNNPPNNLLAALQRLETRHEMKGSKIKRYVDQMIRKWKNLEQKYNRHDSMKDVLFASDDSTKVINREPRDDVKVHYGLIASGNKVIKDATLRDEINGNLKDHVLCVEMEAAGLMDNFPCLVIRGICDYADSYKTTTGKDMRQPRPLLIAGKIGELSEDVRKISQDQERHARNEMLEWLTPFLNGQEKTLLCQGNPGAGKTILTSAVIEHLQNEQFYNDASGESKVNLAFIYFDFIRKESQRTIDVLASLVKQLARDKPSPPTAVKNLQKKHRDIPASSRSDKDIEVFSGALRHLISGKCTKTFFVIDALDECQDGDKFLETVMAVLRDTDAKLFATTRPSQNGEERFKSGLFLEISALTEDVENYIQGRLPEFTILREENHDIREELKVNLRGEIVVKISSAIDGIFLLAKFHVDSLLAKTTLAQIRKTLEGLPRGSDAYKQAYEKTIIRIHGQPSEYQQLARRTLGWLACAAREITALELRHALAIRSDSSSSPSEEELESTNFVIKVCMGLVMVERESDVVRLLHHTAFEYLQQNMTCLWSLEDSETL